MYVQSYTCYSFLLQVQVYMNMNKAYSLLLAEIHQVPYDQSATTSLYYILPLVIAAVTLQMQLREMFLAIVINFSLYFDLMEITKLALNEKTTGLCLRVAVQQPEQFFEMILSVHTSCLCNNTTLLVQLNIAVHQLLSGKYVIVAARLRNARSHVCQVRGQWLAVSRLLANHALYYICHILLYPQFFHVVAACPIGWKLLVQRLQVHYKRLMKYSLLIFLNYKKMISIVWFRLFTMSMWYYILGTNTIFAMVYHVLS